VQQPAGGLDGRWWRDTDLAGGTGGQYCEVAWLVAVVIDGMEVMRSTFLAAVLALMPLAALGQDFDAGLAAFERGDYAVAFNEWRPLAEQGYVGAQTNLGWMYESGQGVPQDDTEAVRWYRLAAEQGDAAAQLSLGLRYTNGRGVPQDYVAAHMWYNLAAADGVSVAVDARDAVARLMTAADISKAQRRARVCLESGYSDCD